jgi:hypothetical protein
VILINITLLAMTILLFYFSTMITYNYLRMVVGFLLTIFLSFTVTIAFEFDYIEYILSVLLLIVFIELIEIKVILNTKRN